MENALFCQALCPISTTQNPHIISRHRSVQQCRSATISMSCCEMLSITAKAGVSPVSGNPLSVSSCAFLLFHNQSGIRLHGRSQVTPPSGRRAVTHPKYQKLTTFTKHFLVPLHGGKIQCPHGIRITIFFKVTPIFQYTRQLLVLRETGKKISSTTPNINSLLTQTSPKSNKFLSSGLFLN